MRRKRYSVDKSSSNKKFIVIAAIIIALIGGFQLYRSFLAPNTPEQAADELKFDSSVAESEKTLIKTAMTEQQKTFSGSVSAKANTAATLEEKSLVLSAYVPVSNKYAVRQSISKAEVSSADVYVLQGTDEVIKAALNEALGVTVKETADVSTVSDDAIAFIPAKDLTSSVKLLSFENSYYLDTFNSGAVFRTMTFSGGNNDLTSLYLGTASKETVFTMTQTGVTALTRTMMKKLNQVGDPKYFSKEIGPLLASADITHVSNEVSFKQNCQYHSILFCSPTEFIETLKDSGIDVVELTGNHNNDVGAENNTQTINTYHQLGWATVGGGLNSAEAAKPYIVEQKGSKVAILAYNYPDSPNGGAISGVSKAGANSFEFSRIESDIAALKSQGVKSVIVDVQFWECYAYPDGYVEYPICDQPITDQKAVFRKIADLGADMVVGTSAHQPQTYEFYNGKSIYYGLGNLYFEQTQWPGTERGIILTHYYKNGALLQTKLTPTVYGKDLVVKVMTAQQSEYLFGRLKSARNLAGLE